MNLQEIVREGMDWTYMFHQSGDISSPAEELIASQGLWVLRFIFYLNPKWNHIPFIFKCPGGVCVCVTTKHTCWFSNNRLPEFSSVPQFLPCHERGGRWTFLVWQHLFKRKQRLLPTRHEPFWMSSFYSNFQKHIPKHA